MNNPLGRRIAPILAVLLLVLVAACDGENPTSPSNSLAGSWSLLTADGVAAPVRLADTPAGQRELLSGSVTLRSGARFTSRITWRDTAEGVATFRTDVVVGRFTLSGTTLQVTVTGEVEPSVTITMSDGNAGMTYVTEGVTLEFQRVATTPPDDLG